MISAGEGIRLSCECGWRHTLSYTTTIEEINWAWVNHLKQARTGDK